MNTRTLIISFWLCSCAFGADGSATQQLADFDKQMNKLHDQQKQISNEIDAKTLAFFRSWLMHANLNDVPLPSLPANASADQQRKYDSIRHLNVQLACLRVDRDQVKAGSLGYGSTEQFMRSSDLATYDSVRQ